ncbi:MAG TPA: hypothetical protein VFZ53_07955 [Polyangiaceae bacterium]
MTRTAPLLLAILFAPHCKSSPPLPARADAAASGVALRSSAAPLPPGTAQGIPSGVGSGASGSASAPAPKECVRQHWPEPWRPRQTTEKPRYSTECGGPDCAGIEPFVELGSNCADKCRAVAIVPRVVSPDAERARSLQRIFEAATVEFRSDDCWLTFLDYTIHHAGSGVLDVSFRASGSGAYPSLQTSHVAVELATLRRVDARAAFSTRSLSELTTRVKRKMLEAWRTAKKTHPEVYEGRDEPVFEHEHLENFVVEAEGVTFLFDFGLPHAVESASPLAEFPFTAAEIRRFVAPAGPLGFLVEPKP